MPTNPYRGSLKNAAARRGGHTRTRQLHIERTLLYAAHLKEEGDFDYFVQSQVPEAWDTLEQDVDIEEKKVRITLRLDESVAKFYRETLCNTRDRSLQSGIRAASRSTMPSRRSA